MASTMRAAQYEKETKKVLVHDIPIPEPAENQLQVKITAASLCHSDVMQSVRLKNQGPVTIGHEAVGVVAKVHPSAEGKGFKVGDKIGMLGNADNCFECEGCKFHATYCVNAKGGFPKLSGLQCDGFFAEYAVIDWRDCEHVPDSLPMDKISPLFCAGITAFHAVDKTELQAGEWLAIVGCGGLGQLAVRYAKAMGFKVICLDIDDNKLNMVKHHGADATFNPKTNPKFFKDIRKLIGRRGCHAAAVFSDSHAAYDTAKRALGFNGLLMIVGLPETPMKFTSFEISMGLLRVKGAGTGTAKEMKKAVDFTAKHHIIPDVEYRKLEEMPQMWELMLKGGPERRMVVLFGDQKSRL